MTRLCIFRCVLRICLSWVTVLIMTVGRTSFIFAGASLLTSIFVLCVFFVSCLFYFVCSFCLHDETQHPSLCAAYLSFHNPLSNNLKAMIREMGKVELIELCETIPKEQCSQCLLHWNQGVIYCTCGHLLVESESSQKFHKINTGCSLYPALRNQEGATPWCSAR